MRLFYFCHVFDLQKSVNKSKIISVWNRKAYDDLGTRNLLATITVQRVYSFITARGLGRCQQMIMSETIIKLVITGNSTWACYQKLDAWILVYWLLQRLRYMKNNKYRKISHHKTVPVWRQLLRGSISESFVPCRHKALQIPDPTPTTHSPSLRKNMTMKTESCVSTWGKKAAKYSDKYYPQGICSVMLPRRRGFLMTITVRRSLASRIFNDIKMLLYAIFFFFLAINCRLAIKELRDTFHLYPVFLRFSFSFEIFRSRIKHYLFGRKFWCPRYQASVCGIQERNVLRNGRSYSFFLRRFFLRSPVSSFKISLSHN